MDRNIAYWIAMAVSLALIAYGVYDSSGTEVLIGAGIIAFVNIYGAIAAKREKGK